jgi:hypothetical protein
MNITTVSVSFGHLTAVPNAEVTRQPLGYKQSERTQKKTHVAN